MWIGTSLVVLSVAAVSTLSLPQSSPDPPSVIRRSDGSYTFSYETPSSSHYASQGRLPSRNLIGQNPKFKIGHSVVRSPNANINNVPDTLSSAASSRSFSLASRNAQSSLGNIFANQASGRFRFVTDDGVHRTVRYEPPAVQVAKAPNSLVNPNVFLSTNPNVFLSTKRSHYPAVYREQVSSQLNQPTRRQANPNVFFAPVSELLKPRASQTSVSLRNFGHSTFKSNESIEQSDEDDEDDDDNSNESLENLQKSVTNSQVVHLNPRKNSGVWGYSFSNLYNTRK